MRINCVFDTILLSACALAVATVYFVGRTNPCPIGQWQGLRDELVTQKQGTESARFAGFPSVELPPSAEYKISCKLYFQPELSFLKKDLCHGYMVLSKDGEIVDVDEFDFPQSLGEKASAGLLVPTNFTQQLRKAQENYCLGKSRAAINAYLKDSAINRRYSKRLRYGLVCKGTEAMIPYRPAKGSARMQVDQYYQYPLPSPYEESVAATEELVERKPYTSLLNYDQIVLECGECCMAELKFDENGICRSITYSHDGVVIWMGS